LQWTTAEDIQKLLREHLEIIGPLVGGHTSAGSSLPRTARSAYVMTQAARTAYEHHIPPVAELRYSITFRTLR
jgi:hypothetical protein